VTFFPRSRRCWKPFPASGTTSLSGAGGLLIWIKDYLERPLGVIRDRVEPSGKSGHVRYAAESRSDADAAIGVSYRDAAATNTMTETVTIDRPSVAKPVSPPRSRKPATVSASALALHLDCSRTYHT